MKFEGELPEKQNQRGGVGWWMDLEGQWRPPSEWPHDSAPVEGWERDASGSWAPPVELRLGDRAAIANTASTVDGPDAHARGGVAVAEKPATAANPPVQNERSALLLVLGALLGAAILVGGALLLISQAGASGDPDTVVLPEVIYRTETDAQRLERLEAGALVAPDQAVRQLDELAEREARSAEAVETALSSFDESQWHVTSDTCLGIDEQVLIDESAVPVTFADELECVVDRGIWRDRYLGAQLDRAIDADIQLLVPPEVVVLSGGDDWDLATREAYMSDVAHPATLHIVVDDGGHNPRSQDPATWRPADETQWCAYAVDWVAVKHRWQLSVTAPERSALTEMLATCDRPGSAGADPFTVPPVDVQTPEIGRVR